MTWSNKLALLIWAAALCSVATPATAQTGTQWIADQNGCLHFNPVPEADERLEWSGACKDKKGQGPGELRWMVGDKLSNLMLATLVDGKAQGRASVYSPKFRSRLEGEFQDGRVHGQGTLCWPNGNCYEGAFAAGAITGQGHLILIDGSRYDGGFTAGEPEGRGCLQRADGARYEGMFARGLPSGPGVSTLPDGTRFEGEFADGKPSGLGQFLSAEGKVLPRPVSVALQQRMSFAPGPPARPRAWMTSDPSSRCPKMVSPTVPPDLNWRGMASFTIRATKKEERTEEFTVVSRRVNGVADERALKALADAIEQAIKSYECKGEDRFQIQQEFVFQID